MEKSAIGLYRLSQQRIAGAKFDTPVEVVRWLGAMQAQDYLQAVWAIGLRTAAGTLDAVERAIEAGAILRTWPMRGTIHFIPAEDAGWMLSLFAGRILAADARRQQQLALDAATLRRAEEAMVAALSGHDCLSRAALLGAVEAAGIATAGGRGYHILFYSAMRGVICIGPTRNKEQTFVLLDAWAGAQRSLTRDEGLAELARRYFTSHAPATLHDFAWWTGSTLTEARCAVAACEPALTKQVIDGTTYYVPTDLPALPDNADDVYFLPGFDEYLLGYKDRSAVLTTEHADKIVPGGNGVFKPFIVHDGAVVGVWTRSVKKKAVEVTPLLFDTLSAAPDALAAAAERYARFHALPLTLRA